MKPEEHRGVRELLGAYALDQLGRGERARLREHLQGCASCRAELAEIAPLRASLQTVRPERVEDLPEPPPELEAAILARIRAEAASVVPLHGARPSRPTLQRPLQVAAGVAVVALAAGAGFGLGARDTGTPIPLEPVRIVSAEAIRASADVVPHTWGMEVKLDAVGFDSGVRYRVSVTDGAGRSSDAGEFIGTGAARMRCNLNSAVLRGDATGFEVTDPSGDVVLTGSLTEPA